MSADCTPGAILSSGKQKMVNKNGKQKPDKVCAFMEFKEQIRIGQANRKRNIPGRENSKIKVPVIGRSMTLAIRVNKINKGKVKSTENTQKEPRS